MLVGLLFSHMFGCGRLIPHIFLQPGFSAFVCVGDCFVQTEKLTQF